MASPPAAALPVIEGVFRTLVAVPAEVNFALDPNFAILYPYRNPARPGDRLPIELRVTNHGTADAMARASLVTPPGWSVSPGEATTTIAAGESGALRFVVEVPAGSVGRHVLCAELALGERPASARSRRDWSTSLERAGRPSQLRHATSSRALAWPSTSPSSLGASRRIAESQFR